MDLEIDISTIPTNCRECNADLSKESFFVTLPSGGYCERCYNYWYEYKNRRYTPEQALARNLGMFPYGIHNGKIEFKMPSPQKIKAQGRMWHSHPSDWEKLTRSLLDKDQILLDGVNWFPEEKKVELKAIDN